MKRFSRTRILRYSVAILCTTLAIGFRLQLDPVLGSGIPFATLFLAILVAAWYGGFGPAIVATLLGGVASIWLFLPSAERPALPGYEWQTALALYVVVSLGIAGLGGAMREARKQAEAEASAALLQQEELRTTLASIGDAVLVTDAAGRVVSLNSVAESLTGWTMDDAVGKPLETVFTIVNERTRAPVISPVTKVLQEGKVIGLANHTLLISRDGTERPIDDSAAPIYQKERRLAGVVLVFRDVTERRSGEEVHRRLAAIVESSDDAIIGKDLEGRITSWNAGAERLYGYGAGEILGKPFSILVPPEHTAEVPNAIGRLRQGERLDHFETVRQRKDGTRIVVSMSYSPIKDGDGLLMGTAVITRDITTQKLAEESARQWQRQLQLVTDSAPVLLAHLDIERRFKFVNKPYAARFGLHPRDIVGKTIPEVLGEEAYAVIRPHVDTALSGKHVEFVVEIPYQILGPVTMRCAYEPEFNSDGQVVGYVGAMLDVTRSNRVERALREAESRFAALVNHSPAAIFLKDPQGRYLLANQRFEEIARSLGADESYLGKTDADLLPPALAERFHAEDAEVIRTKEAKVYEESRKIRGERRTGLTTKFPLLNEGGEVYAVCGIDLDITDRVKAEEALRQSEERSRTILESITDAFYAIDGDWRFTYLNRQAEELLGQNRSALIGRNIWEEFPAAVGSAFDEAYHRAVVEKVTISFEVFYPPHQRWYEVHAYPSPDGLAVYFRDISERRRLTEALEAERQRLVESEERLRLALEAGRMGVWDWNIRTNEIKWSDNLEPVHGLAPGSFGGTLEAFQNLVHPEDREFVNRTIAICLQERSSYDIEFRIVWPDSSVHWMSGVGRVFSDSEGQAVRMIGVGLDITERKRAEHDAKFLADASATLAGLVDFESTLQKVARLAVPHFADWVAVDMLDERGGLRRLAVAHVDPAKVELGHEVYRRFPPDPGASQGVWNILRTGKSELVTEIDDALLVATVKEPDLLRILRELGLRSYIGVPLPVRGKVLGVITFISAESGRLYDTCDLAMAEDLAHRAAVAIDNAQLYHEVRQADRRKDEFLAILGHELRNPLAPISNALQVLKMPGASAQVLEQAREMMERQVRHMVRLVDDLLDVSRIVRGKVDLRKEPVELATMVAHAIETSRPLIEAEGHELKVFLPSEPLRVAGDLVRLAQILGNLLNNAARYTERGGKIHVEGEARGDKVLLRVKDTGIGIAPEVLPHIWDMFVQADRSSKASQGGMGIGLALVKGLVELHGGTVEAHSAGLGKGSEFTISLPLLRSSRSSDGLPGESLAKAKAPRRILVVDDNVDAAESLAMLLRLGGHEVRVAHDGLSALELMENDPPEVAFIDIGMPGMDGHELAQRVRSCPSLTGITLIALTGWGQAEDRRRTREAGFDGHEVKPVSHEALNQLLGQWAILRSAK